MKKASRTVRLLGLDLDVTRGNAHEILSEYGEVPLVLVGKRPKVGQQVILNIHGTDRLGEVIELHGAPSQTCIVKYNIGTQSYQAARRFDLELWQAPTT